MKRSRQRQARGAHFLAEGPIILWVMLFFIFVPLLDFGAVFFRSTFLYMAVHNAARNAAKSRSFLNDLSGELPATNMANSTVSSVIGMWSGVSVSSVLTQIVVTDINTDVVSYLDNPLPPTAPADDSKNTYQIQVTVTGTVAPLFIFNMPWFVSGGVPGLTKVMNVTMSDRQYCENPQGLIL